MNFEKLKAILVDSLGCDADAVLPEASLTADLGADSLDAVQLMMDLEEAFGVSIPDEDIGSLKTVGDIASYLESR